MKTTSWIVALVVMCSCSEALTTTSPNDGECGAANGVTSTAAPTSALCRYGTASAVSGSGPWTWSCAGMNGGKQASCVALSPKNPATPVDGACGAANGAPASATPDDGLCSAGGASAVGGSGPWSWTCAGANGGTTASCSAPPSSPDPMNGACGAANGVATLTAPASGLCTVGTASPVSGSGPWSWTCAGLNGGTTAPCSAPLSSPDPMNGACGAANGVATMTAPVSGLCTVGTASAVSGSGPWSWTCAGLNGGTTAPCSAAKASCTPQCASKVCGDDGCGGSCGTCSNGQSCSAAGQCGGLPAGVTLKPIDGGPTFYGDHGFTFAHNAGWDDPSFFAIGVWLDMMLTQADADRWKDLGLNTAFTITSNSNLSLLRQNGIWSVLQYGEFSSFASSIGAETVGLMSADEGGLSDAVTTPLGMMANSVQDGRYWWMNNTWNFINYGDLSTVPAPQVLATLVSTPNGTKRHIDVQSVDDYWFAGAKPGGFLLYSGGLIYSLGRDMTSDEAARGSHYGDMVDRLRAYQTTYPGPILQFIEDGGPYNEDATANDYITPPELNWSVWSSIIHGARQICYFNHSFAGPAQSDDNLAQTYYKTVQAGQTISIYDQVKATNARIKQLAPVINAPTADGYVTTSRPAMPLSGIETMAKFSGGQFYVFATTRESETATNLATTFTLADSYTGTVTVIGENRTIQATNGTFTDTFASGSTVHLYKIGT